MSKAERERQQILEEMKKKTQLLTDSSWIRQRSSSFYKDPVNVGLPLKRRVLSQTAVFNLDSLQIPRFFFFSQYVCFELRLLTCRYESLDDLDDLRQPQCSSSYPRPHSAAAGYVTPSRNASSRYSTGSIFQRNPSMESCHHARYSTHSCEL